MLAETAQTTSATPPDSCVATDMQQLGAMPMHKLVMTCKVDGTQRTVEVTAQNSQHAALKACAMCPRRQR